MSSNYCFNVTVFRDGLSTPWGFRLEGGKDFGSPLQIQRVFQGSPASGYLQRGDLILNIQNRDTSQLYHQEANELIRQAGGSLQLTVKRGQAYPGSDGAAYNATHNTSSYTYSAPTKITTTTYTQHFNPTRNNRQPPVVSQYQTVNYSQDYDHANARPYDPNDPSSASSLVRNRPIERIHDPKPILSQTGSPILPGATPNMSGRSSSSFQLRRYQQSKTLPLPKSNIQVNTTMPPFHEKQMIDKLTNSLQKITFRQPAITLSSYPSTSTANIYQSSGAYNNQYQQQQDPEEYGSMHVHDKVAQIHRQNVRQQPQAQHRPQQYNTLPKRQSIHGSTFNLPSSNNYQQQYNDEPYVPAWTGTLKSNAGTSYHSVQAPKPKPQQQQFKPTQSQTIEFGNIGPLKIVNSQYNTPLGLYSNKNITEELTKQVGGISHQHPQQHQQKHHSGYELPASDF